MKTVAEGAETPAGVQTLRRFGCDTVQGYYYSRPLHGGEPGHLAARPPGARPRRGVADPSLSRSGLGSVLPARPSTGRQRGSCTGRRGSGLDSLSTVRRRRAVLHVHRGDLEAVPLVHPRRSDVGGVDVQQHLIDSQPLQVAQARSEQRLARGPCPASWDRPRGRRPRRDARARAPSSSGSRQGCRRLVRPAAVRPG